MDWEKIRAALIRFVWTWLFAFFAQPAIAAMIDGSWAVSWRMAASAALAAAIYALKKLLAPDSII